MADVKTKRTGASVTAFINGIEDRQRRADARKVAAMMRAATGEKPKLWGPSMVGYGSYHYRYASGREGEWFLTGFSPRKQNISVYIMPGFDDFDALLKKLGKCKTGKSCLYIRRLADIDENVLDTLIIESVRRMRDKYVSGRGSND
jgi:hypothetical protein